MDFFWWAYLSMTEDSAASLWRARGSCGWGGRWPSCFAADACFSRSHRGDGWFRHPPASGRSWPFPGLLSRLGVWNHPALRIYRDWRSFAVQFRKILESRKPLIFGLPGDFVSTLLKWVLILGWLLDKAVLNYVSGFKFTKNIRRISIEK